MTEPVWWRVSVSEMTDRDRAEWEAAGRAFRAEQAAAEEAERVADLLEERWERSHDPDAPTTSLGRAAGCRDGLEEDDYWRTLLAAPAREVDQ